MLLQGEIRKVDNHGRMYGEAWEYLYIKLESEDQTKIVPLVFDIPGFFRAWDRGRQVRNWSHIVMGAPSGSARIVPRLVESSDAEYYIFTWGTTSDRARIPLFFTDLEFDQGRARAERNPNRPELVQMRDSDLLIEMANQLAVSQDQDGQ